MQVRSKIYAIIKTNLNCFTKKYLKDNIFYIIELISSRERMCYFNNIFY